jgi:hypothetical protein
LFTLQRARAFDNWFSGGRLNEKLLFVKKQVADYGLNRLDE